MPCWTSRKATVRKGSQTDQTGPCETLRVQCSNTGSLLKQKGQQCTVLLKTIKGHQQMNVISLHYIISDIALTVRYYIGQCGFPGQCQESTTSVACCCVMFMQCSCKLDTESLSSISYKDFVYCYILYLFKTFWVI